MATEGRRNRPRKEDMKYRVNFEFMYIEPEISDGKWHQDFLDNNGDGFTFEDAERAAGLLRVSNVCRVHWAEVVEMKEA